MRERTLQKRPPSIAMESLRNIVGNSDQEKMVRFTLSKPGVLCPVTVTRYPELARILRFIRKHGRA